MPAYPCCLTDSEWKLLRPCCHRGPIPCEGTRSVTPVAASSTGFCISFARAAVEKKPTAAIIDSQSVRTAGQSGVCGEKITGRKRHVVVDTQGNILTLKIITADGQNRDGAQSLLGVLTHSFGWLKLIWADGGYAGKLLHHVSAIARHRRVKLEIVKRSDDIKGFKVLPKQWIVKRAFGRLIQSRGLIQDHEVRIDYSEAMIYLSMSRRMLARIKR